MRRSVLLALLLATSANCGTRASASAPLPSPLSKIVAPASATFLVPALRLNPPDPQPLNACNYEGLNCLEFAPPELTGCEEMEFYRVQAGLPDRWGDEPRTGPVRQKGIGWRESNCRNDVTTYCCGGYWQIGWGNITAYGYRAFGIWDRCKIASRYDYVGTSSLQKQKSACAAKGLFDYHTAHGEDPAYAAWDRYL